MPPPGGGRGGFRGGKPGFKKGQGGARKSFGDRAGGERKSFGFKKSFDRGGAPAERSGPPGAFKKSYGDRPERGAPGGERKSFGFKKSFDRPERSGPPGAFKKSYGDRPERGAPGGERKSFGFKKSFDRPERSGPPGAFKKSYADRPAGEGGFKKSWGERPEGGERKSFGFKKPGGDRKPFERGAPGGFKKSFDRGGPGGGGDRPAFGFKKKSFDRAPGEERIKKYDRPGTNPRAERDFPPRAPAAPVIPPGAEGRWVWGINPVLEALRAHPEQVEKLFLVEGLLTSSTAAEILSRAREANLKIEKVERDRLTSMIGGGVHQGVVAEVLEYQYKELEDLLELAKASGRPPLIVVLDGIQDPHNLGAIIRSAHSFGAHGVVIAKDRAAGVTGVVAKSSAGAIEHCPVARVTNLSRALEQLKEAGCWTVAADPEGTQPAWSAKLEGPLVVVVGAEGPGVREGVLDKCDFKVLIPMSGQVASLNASVSAGILLYEVSRQRAAHSAV